MARSSTSMAKCHGMSVFFGAWCGLWKPVNRSRGLVTLSTHRAYATSHACVDVHRLNTRRKGEVMKCRITHG